MFGFEDLNVWNRAIEFGGDVYAVTRGFPSDERFGLTSQMRRAAVSISANIAEGTSRWSRNDQARFMEIAAGSNFEVVSLAKIATNQGLLSDEQYAQLYTTAEVISRMLSGLRNSMLERAS